MHMRCLVATLGALAIPLVHEARIIPTDGRPHGTIPRWTGDLRGRWEGDTLVVDTVNFRREGKQFIAVASSSSLMVFGLD